MWFIVLLVLLTPSVDTIPTTPFIIKQTLLVVENNLPPPTLRSARLVSFAASSSKLCTTTTNKSSIYSHFLDLEIDPINSTSTKQQQHQLSSQSDRNAVLCKWGLSALNVSSSYLTCHNHLNSTHEVSTLKAISSEYQYVDQQNSTPSHLIRLLYPFPNSVSIESIAGSSLFSTPNDFVYNLCHVERSWHFTTPSQIESTIHGSAITHHPQTQLTLHKGSQIASRIDTIDNNQDESQLIVDLLPDPKGPSLHPTLILRISGGDACLDEGNMLLVQGSLPKSVFIDPYQMHSPDIRSIWNVFGTSPIIELEQPVGGSNAHAHWILIKVPPTSNDALSTANYKVDIPLHTRYHPAVSGGSNIMQAIGPFTISCVGNKTGSFELMRPVDWSKILGFSNHVNITIPQANSDNYDFVRLATFMSLGLGLFLVLSALYCFPPNPSTQLPVKPKLN